MTPIDTVTHRTDVSAPAEARKALEAADTLGLELKDVRVYGNWRARDGSPPAHRSTWSLHNRTRDARTWFYLVDNKENCFAARPSETGERDSRLELRFD